MQYVEYFSIAIDGPAGAGKSTIAKLAAEELGFVYMDTGTMYRSMALYFIRQDISSGDKKAATGACSRMEVTIHYAGEAQQVVLNEEDISELIRSEEVGRMASATSVYGPIRQKLIQLQKQLIRGAGVVMNGRGIGTYVLPDAPTKIYLTASVEIHARHRFRKLEGEGVVCDIREIEKDIEERGYRDIYRENSPLRQAEGAVLLDSSHMTIGQVVDPIIRIARERGYEG